MAPRLTLACAAVLSLVSVGASAEVEVPRRNPRARVSQFVGLTEVTVDYNSPAVRGRAIWGALVPYGEIWRSGDTPAARIAFSRDVVFAGKPVAAGTYALLAIPAAGEWTFVLNGNANLVETSRDHRPELDVARVKVGVKAAPHRERLTFLFSDFTDQQAVLDLEWERVHLAIPLQVNTRQQVLAEIGALDNVWRAYANAARYMLETRKDYDAGLAYVERSLALGENWRNLWIKASLLAAKGRYEEAGAEGRRAYELGRRGGGGAGTGGGAGSDAFSEAEVTGALTSWSRAANRSAAAPVPAAVALAKAVPAVARPSRGGTASPAAFVEEDPPAPMSPPPADAAPSAPTSPRPLVAAPSPTPSPVPTSLPPPASSPGPASASAPPSASGPASSQPASKPSSRPPSVLDERPVAIHESRRPAERGGAAGTPRPSDIAPIIERGRADIQTCYQRALRQDPSLTHAKVVISITIGVSGTVRQVALDSPQRFRAIEPCIKEAISRWAFPVSSAEYGAELPIVLQGNE